MTEPTKDQIRDALITHLGTLQSWGVKDVLINPVDLTATDTDTADAPASVSKVADLSACQNLAELQGFIGNCSRCKLHKQRKNLVFGVGNEQADLMFVGEGPGADEDEQGIPFVGRAGQLLTKMIEAMGYARDDVYIANVVKCRPPGNRNPEEDEVASCQPFLNKQIEIVQPKVIVALGKFAAQTVCDTQVPISRMRGKFREMNGIQIMPTFHPSYLLRNPEMKRPVWEDLKKVMAYLS